MGASCLLSVPGTQHTVSCSRNLAWGKKLRLWAPYSDIGDATLEQFFPVWGQLWEISLFQRAPLDKKQAAWGCVLFSSRLKNITLSNWCTVTPKVKQKAALTSNTSVTAIELQKVWDFPFVFATHLLKAYAVVTFSRANKNLQRNQRWVFIFQH